MYNHVQVDQKLYPIRVVFNQLVCFMCYTSHKNSLLAPGAWGEVKMEGKRALVRQKKPEYLLA